MSGRKAVLTAQKSSLLYRLSSFVILRRVDHNHSMLLQSARHCIDRNNIELSITIASSTMACSPKILRKTYYQKGDKSINGIFYAERTTQPLRISASAETLLKLVTVFLDLSNEILEPLCSHRLPKCRNPSGSTEQYQSPTRVRRYPARKDARLFVIGVEGKALTPLRVSRRQTGAKSLIRFSSDYLPPRVQP